MQRKSAPEYLASCFGGFADYIKNKRIKLSNQDKELRDRAELDNVAQIFTRTAIHVNGYTVPSREEIRTFVVLGGGVFIPVLENKRKVTHIVASNLTMKKQHDFRNYKVVKPEWIKDSVDAGRLLPWTDYRLIIPKDGQLTIDSGQLEKNTSIQSTQTSINDTFRVVSNLGKKSSKSDQLKWSSPEEYNEILLKTPKLWESSVLNPNFLTKYFENSRLHHLSVWKAQLKLRYNNDRNLTNNYAPKYIFHIDFDSFFAAVGLRDRPELFGKPVVVCHGIGETAEISSCNYEARKFGISNGSSFGSAKKLCPDIQAIPYEFNKYQEASDKFYQVITEIGADQIRAISIDEALLDVTSLIFQEVASDHETRAKQLAFEIKQKVKQLTDLNVSVGIAENIVLARIALKIAKPNNVFHLKAADAASSMKDLDVQELPGIGYSISKRLFEKLKACTIGDLIKVPKSDLLSLLGSNLGEKIWRTARGLDESQVADVPIRKTVSVEVNWGVRFYKSEQVTVFLQSLCDEAEKRLDELCFEAQKLSIKVMVRPENVAFDTWKHMGHGIVNVLVKSMPVKRTSKAKYFFQGASALVAQMNVSPGNIRGIGISLTKLCNIKTDGKQLPLTFIRKTEKDRKGSVAIEYIERDDSFENQRESETSFVPKKNQKRKQITLTQENWVKPKITVDNRFIGSTQYGLVDRAVLYELPYTERHLILEDLNKSAKLKQLQSKLTLAAQPMDKNNSNFRLSRKIDWPGPFPTEIEFQEKINFAEILTTIRSWILLCSEGPHDMDVEILTNYLQSLVCNKYIDKACAIVKLMCAMSKQYKRTSLWSPAIKSILKEIVTACNEIGIKSIEIFD